jgi:hypothetical protein
LIEVRGGGEWGRVAKALKDAGDKGLQREFAKTVNRALKPVKAEISQSAQSTLPRRGGLADEVAGFKVVTRRPESGVKLVSRGRYSGYHMNQGVIRHGKGNRTQATPPGWWDRPTEAAAPDVRRKLVEAMDDIIRKIDRAA